MIMFSQIGTESNRYLLIYQVIDYCTDTTNIKLADSFITSGNGSQHTLQTTEGWEVLVKEKYESSIWEEIKDIRKYYPVQLCKYTIESRTSDEPEFA